MSRHFFVCVDGTMCQPEADTNIYKIFRLIGGAGNRNAIYQEGIASMSSAKFLQTIMPTEINNEAYQIYKLLAARDITAEDKLYIFGYSRGAIIARILAQMITSDGARRTIVSHANQVVSVNRNTVDFLGLFDPVRGNPYPFGIPGYESDLFKNPSIRNITEVVAIDDTFRFFRSDASIIAPKDKKERLTTIELIAGRRETSHEKIAANRSLTYNMSRHFCLFPGVHKDVGGQSSNLAVSRIALLMMLQDLLSVHPDVLQSIDQTLYQDMHLELDVQDQVLLGLGTSFARKCIWRRRNFRADPRATLHPLAKELDGKRGIARHLFFGRWRHYRIPKAIKGWVSTHIQ